MGNGPEGGWGVGFYYTYTSDEFVYHRQKYICIYLEASLIKIYNYNQRLSLQKKNVI